MRWNPFNPFAMDALAVSASNYPNVEKRLEIWEYVAKVAPKRWESNYYLAAVYANELGRFQDALPYFEKAVELNPNHAPAVMAVGAMLANTGKYGKAVEMFERAAKLSPADTLVYINLWKTYSAVGDGVKAQDALNKYWALKNPAPVPEQQQ